MKTMTAKTNLVRAISTLLIALMLAACATDGEQKQLAGKLLGAGLGAYAGSKIGKGRGQLAATAVGALGGAFIGGAIGESLDKVDKLHAKRAQNQALAAPIGQPISWRNPDSGNSGAVVATREGTNRASGAYCREYQTTITVDGQNQTAFGTACRQPDGAWKMF